MKAYELRQFGLENLALIERDAPEAARPDFPPRVWKGGDSSLPLQGLPDYSPPKGARGEVIRFYYPLPLGGEGGPQPALSPAGAGRAYARRRGTGEP